MFALDLFNTKYERELKEGAVDNLEARRIDDLNMKMLDLLDRAKGANPKMRDALKREFQKIKAERDSYFKINPATGMNASGTLGTTKGKLDDCMGYGTVVGEDRNSSPVAGAITRRILMQRHDLLKQYGPELVTAAIDNVADYVGDVEEIGSSDVSAWVSQVECMLKENPPEAFAEETNPYGDYKQSPRAFGTGNFQRLLKANMGNIPTVTLEFPNPKDNIHLDKNGIDLISDYYDGLENDQMKNHFIYRVLPSADEVLTTLKRLGWHSAVQPELPGIPAQGELPLQEKKKFDRNSDLAAGDVKVARELQRLRAQYPAAKSDVEAVAKAEIDSSERSQQQLNAIKGANTEQDRLLQQLVALDRKQGNEIGSLDDENDRLEQQLAHVEKTNANLAQAIDQMGGQGQTDSTNATGKPQSRAIDLIPNAPADGAPTQAQPQAQPAAAEPAEPKQKFKSKSNAMSQMAHSLAQPRQVQGVATGPAPSSMKNYSGDNVVDLFPDNDEPVQTKPIQSLKAAESLEEGQRLQRGDPVVVTAPNKFEGKTGEIYDFSPSGSFVIVDLYNHGKHSMHLSDIAYNDYADQEEEDDWYDDADEFGKPGSEFFPEGFQDFNKVEPYAVCLAGKPVKKFDYYEQARRFHDNWKQKLYREGNKAKADKITLMPIMDEDAAMPPQDVSPPAIIAPAPSAKYMVKKPQAPRAQADEPAPRYPKVNPYDDDESTLKVYKPEQYREAKADPTGSWVVYNSGKIVKFKTHTGAKAYAAKNGGKVASSEFYADKIQKPVNELDVNTLKSYADKRGAQVAAMQADNPNAPAGTKAWIQQAIPAQKVARAKQKIARKERQQGVAETALNPKDPQGDYAAKRKALQDLGMNKDVDQAAVLQRRLDLDREAKAKGIKEGRPEDLPGIDYDRPGDRPRKPSSGEHNPYPYSPEEDEDYFREIFRKKREAAAKAQGGGLKEFAPGQGGGSGNYFQALASAWYNGTFNTGSLQKGIKSKEDVERLLQRGVLCPDGVTRKFGIDYNSDFDGVVISSDDYYEHADYNDQGQEVDSRTGQKWGPYDYMEFSDDDLSESLNELSTEKLAQYKTAAALDAGAADRAGNYERGDKRFSGIVKATKKQFANDLKKHKPVSETPTDYQKRRQRERDVDAGRPVKTLPKNPQTDYARKRAKEKRDLEQFGEGILDKARNAVGWLQDLRGQVPARSDTLNNRGTLTKPTSPPEQKSGEFSNQFIKYLKNEFAGNADNGPKIAHQISFWSENPKDYKNNKIATWTDRANVFQMLIDTIGYVDSKYPGKDINSPKMSNIVYTLLGYKLWSVTKKDLDQGVVEGLMKEPTTRKEYLDQRDKLFRMMAVDSNPANKQIIKQALQDLEARYGKLKDPVREESSTASDAVERAILNRIMVAHTNLLMQFGPDKVMQAAEEVAYNAGDVDEIGTSDVSAYVNQVKQILGA